MSTSSKTIVFVTAGAGGMLCGSCLHDNALVGAMRALGADVILVPAYTPIRTDDVDHSIDRVVLGGVNLYLQQALPWWKWVPSWITRHLDSPTFLRRVASRQLETDPARLGSLTLSMLRGEAGPQREEIHKMLAWLREDVRPGLLVFSNLMIASAAPRIKRELKIPVLVILQGDDLFLDQLRPDYRSRAWELLRGIATQVDGFLVHSQDYARRMQQRLEVDGTKFHQVPLGIECLEPCHASPAHLGRRSSGHDGTVRIGYLARLAPEKGLHLLCQAFVELHGQAASLETQSPATGSTSRPETPNDEAIRSRSQVGPRLELWIAGWAGPESAVYLETCLRPVRAAGLADQVHYFGELSRTEKFAFLRDLDLFCVPSPHPDPKGLYVLEALSVGTPVIAPRHGAFPELLAELPGGLLFEPEDPTDLARCLRQLIHDPILRDRLGETGAETTRRFRNMSTVAGETLTVLRRYIEPAGS